MRILMAASTAAALIVSTAAFAATSEPASPPAAPQQQAATPHKVVARHRDRDPIGDRETAALNSLEASGYYAVKDIHPDGKNIAADAQKPGADFVHLTVLPDGTIQPAGNPAT
jgi:hypothetical protein